MLSTLAGFAPGSGLGRFGWQACGTGLQVADKRRREHAQRGGRP